MKKNYSRTRSAMRNLLLLSLTSSLVLPLSSQAAVINLATSPLATSTTSTVQPNILFMIDNSGSMGWEYMPDAASSFSGRYGQASSQCNQVYYDPNFTYNPPVLSTSISLTGGSTTSGSTTITYASNTSPTAGQTINGSGIPLNTTITSIVSSTQATISNAATATATGVTFSIGSYPNASFTSAWNDGFNTGAGTTNLSTSFSTNGFSSQPAFYYTYSGTQTTADYSNTGSTFYQECRSSIGNSPGNGVFTKVIVSSTSGPGGTDERTNFANWYSYYHTRMLMMKTSTGKAFSPLTDKYRVGLMKISSSTPVQYMSTFSGTNRDNWYSALYGITTSGSTPLRRALSDAGWYYAGKLSGADPVQYSCQQNFTILSTDGYWNQGDGKKLDSSLMDNQDGDITVTPRPMYDGTSVGGTYTNVYTRTYYHSKHCNGGRRKPRDTIQTGSCQVTTAGASCTPSSWSNGSTTTGSCTSGLGSPYSPSSYSVATLQSSTPTTSGGSSNSLSDAAMYYYSTDLRTTALGNCTGAVSGEDVCTNNVFTTPSDNNQQQHMTTFTLGLGASGRMQYSSSYLSDTSGDYLSVKLGSVADATTCTWQTTGSTCNWPLPGSDQIENIDDLWHAAVDGHGAYFSATNPTTLAAGLANALSGINAKRGSAAAAATSTLNPVAGNNFAYVASYTTVTWNGNLEARGINVDTGVVNENATWCAEDVAAGACASPSSIVTDTSGATTTYYCSTPNSVTCTGGIQNGTDCWMPMATACTGTMKSTVSDLVDTRTIYTANSTGTALTPFDSAYATANPTNFSAAHINGLSQWASYTGGQQSAAVGTNLINYLRGQWGYEDRTTNLVADRLYRYRSTVLGDAVESQPAFMANPVFSYPYPGYSAYATAQAARAGTVYMGTNDGMMHAFDATNGNERWAYVPTMVIPNMWKLADFNYVHSNFVNGSPITSDICSANCTNSATAVWKTILVAGLNGGGRGYYALDITDPAAPALLWEFTTTAGTGTVQDDDLGYSFGQPIITRKQDGTWVVLVTSGYNNVSPGTGKEFLYVLNANTGAIISKIGTGVGSTTTPGGLAKIAGFNANPSGNEAGYVYGGDLQGNLWRFDINSTVTATVGTGDVMKFAALYSDGAGTNPQPITTTPVLGKISGFNVVFIGTGQYLSTSDLTTTQVQTEYAIKDDNATATLVNPRNSLVNQTIIPNPDGTATRVSGTTNSVNFYTDRGWYVDFPDTGERANLDGKLVLGTLLVPTIVPSNTACSPGGYGWLNYFDYKTGGAVNTNPALVSNKYDAPIVGINVIYVQGQPKTSVVTATNPTPTQDTTVQFKANAPTFSGKRVIWRELIP